MTFGKIKRGNREIIITSKEGDVRRYLVPLSRQIIVQENDYVKAGGALSDGAITPSDILNILGLTKVQARTSQTKSSGRIPKISSHTVSAFHTKSCDLVRLCGISSHF